MLLVLDGNVNFISFILSTFWNILFLQKKVLVTIRQKQNFSKIVENLMHLDADPLPATNFFIIFSTTAKLSKSLYYIIKACLKIIICLKFFNIPIKSLLPVELKEFYNKHNITVSRSMWMCNTVMVCCNL